MKKAGIGLLALGMLMAVCGGAAAATNTISWSPVTTYTNGTAISGATVTYSVYWSTSSSLSPATTIATGLSSTSKTFDPSALGMAAGSTVYFAMKTSLSTGQVSSFSTPKSWAVPSPPVSKTLSSIAIGGASSVNEGASSTYTATATWSDGTTTSVTPTWSLSSTTYASIGSTGTLTAKTVSANQSVTVNASFVNNGTTKTAAKSVTIVDLEQPAPASPVNVRISKPETLPEDTWRLSWDSVTTYANGEDLEAGNSVRYEVYWTRDPSLAADNLVALAASTSAAQIDFRPLAQGMRQKERVYFLLRSVLGTGDPSALSEYLPWRVLNKEPVAPRPRKSSISKQWVANN